MFSGGGDVVVVFAGEAQLSAVALVHDVPQLFGGQRLQKIQTFNHARSFAVHSAALCLVKLQV